MMNTESHNAVSTWMKRALLAGACVAMAACTTLPDQKQERPTTQAPAKTAPAPRAPATTGGLQNFQGACQQTEVDGFSENARLAVAGGEVKQLDWQVKVGKRGQCSFNLKDFRQTKQHPHIELSSVRDRRCRLMVYQEARRVTLAHAGCDSQCTNGVAEEAWPVMFNPRTGRCANLH